MFNHSGYPKSWNRKRFELYALYEARNDCFLYVHHDLQVIRTVQALLLSKASTWVYELWLPMNNTPTVSITNENCHQWTLPVGSARPQPTYYQMTFEDTVKIDCQEVNILGQMSGIDMKDQANVSEASKTFKNYAECVGWFVSKLNDVNLVADDVLSRVAVLDQVYQKSNILDHDVYLFISEVYKTLMLSQTVEEIKTNMSKLQPKLTQVISVNKFSEHKINFLKGFFEWSLL